MKIALKTFLALCGLMFMVSANAEYRMHVPLKGLVGETVWTETDRDCSEWTPDESAVEVGEVFTQTKTCNVTYSSNTGLTKTEVETETNESVGTAPIVWSDTNSNCGVWSPSTDTYPTGEEFTQTRICDVEQESNFGDTRTVQEEEEQTAYGTTDIAWTETGRTCGDWSPETSTVKQGQMFTQSRSCDVDQENNFGETRTVQNTETQDAIGTGDIVWTETAVGECTAWSPGTDSVKEGVTFDQFRTCETTETSNWGDTRTNTKDEVQEATGTGSTDWETTSVNSCSAWTPDSSTIKAGQTYTKERTCDVTQTSNWGETRETTITESEQGTGTGSTTWTESARTCQAWSPATSTVKQGQSFTQTRNCNVTETSNWGETRQSTDIESQSAVGTGATTWVESNRSCTAWTPGTNTVKSGESFTQSRDCDVTETSNWGETRDSSDTESRAATGTGATTWTETSRSCGAWAPSTSDYPEGQNFTQSRDCTVTETSNWGETRTSSDTDEQSATGVGYCGFVEDTFYLSEYDDQSWGQTFNRIVDTTNNLDHDQLNYFRSNYSSEWNGYWHNGYVYWVEWTNTPRSTVNGVDYYELCRKPD